MGKFKWAKFSRQTVPWPNGTYNHKPVLYIRLLGPSCMRPLPDWGISVIASSAVCASLSQCKSMTQHTKNHVIYQIQSCQMRVKLAVKMHSPADGLDGCSPAFCTPLNPWFSRENHGVVRGLSRVNHGLITGCRTPKSLPRHFPWKKLKKHNFGMFEPCIWGCLAPFGPNQESNLFDQSGKVLISNHPRRSGMTPASLGVSWASDYLVNYCKPLQNQYSANPWNLEPMEAPTWHQSWSNTKRGKPQQNRSYRKTPGFPIQPTIFLWITGKHGVSKQTRQKPRVLKYICVC